jgi:hypothetical protein
MSVRLRLLPLLAVLLGLAPAVATAQAPECASPTYQPQTLCPGLTGSGLLACLRADYGGGVTLDYADARDQMFGVIDNDGGTVEAAYTGFTISGIPQNPSQSPRTDAFNQGVDTEHTWPQSLGLSNDEPGGRSDLHHLFPTRRRVNSARGNAPLLEIDDADTDDWYRDDDELTSAPPPSVRDLYSERDTDGSFAFEPREVHEGNAARAVFYVWTVYDAEVGSFQSFFDQQKDDLRAWHQGDPADQAEYERTCAIADVQGNRVNPFVIDPTLVDRAFFGGPAPTTPTLRFQAAGGQAPEDAGTVPVAVTITNPDAGAATSVEVVLSGGTATAGTDFAFTTTTVTFPAGTSTPQTVDVPLTDDAEAEGDETIQFTLQNPSAGAVLAAPTTFTLTILDDDGTAPGGGGFPGLILSEVVDGDESGGVPKYVEVFNAHASNAYSLGGLELRRYANGGTTPSTRALDAVTLGPGAAWVVASGAFQSSWGGVFGTGVQPDQIDGTGTVSGNGDDVYELYDTASGTVLDVYGVVGEDPAPGTAWNYQDGVATRGPTTNDGNDGAFDAPTWTLAGYAPTAASPGTHTVTDFLPVELTAFAATPDGPDAVRLAWTTASETANAGFAVERRTGGPDAEVRDAGLRDGGLRDAGPRDAAWQRLGFVAGAGTTTEAQTYAFTDRRLPFEATRATYRLRQVDFDGTATRSDAVTVELGAPTRTTLHAPFPQPTREAATVRYALAEAGAVTLGVYDALGRRVATLVDAEHGAGPRTVRLDTRGWASGVYLVRLQTRGGVQTQRLTVVR